MLPSTSPFEKSSKSTAVDPPDVAIVPDIRNDLAEASALAAACTSCFADSPRDVTAPALVAEAESAPRTSKRADTRRIIRSPVSVVASPQRVLIGTLFDRDFVCS